jgi:hypothetical protein
MPREIKPMGQVPFGIRWNETDRILAWHLRERVSSVVEGDVDYELVCGNNHYIVCSEQERQQELEDMVCRQESSLNLPEDVVKYFDSDKWVTDRIAEVNRDDPNFLGEHLLSAVVAESGSTVHIYKLDTAQWV